MSLSARDVPLLAWLLIMLAPSLNIPLSIVFHGLARVLGAGYRLPRIDRWKIGIQQVCIVGPPFVGVWLLARPEPQVHMLPFIIVMAAGVALVTWRKLSTGQMYLASRKPVFREQLLGLIYDGTVGVFMLYVGVVKGSQLWLLGGLLRLHYNLWSMYHLRFLNDPPWSYGYIAGSLGVFALLVYPLRVGALTSDGVFWLFSTVAQVFAAILGVVGMFAIFALQHVSSTCSDQPWMGLPAQQLLTDTTTVRDGVIGFVLVNLGVMALSGLVLTMSASEPSDAYLSMKELLGPLPLGTSLSSLRAVLLNSLIIVTLAAGANALGYVALFIRRVYGLGERLADSRPPN